MTLQLPIGRDNFKKIIDEKLDFVDKSLFIKEVLDDRTAEAIVITRPRRFGKTLNLSMLNHFLAAEVNGQSSQGLFNGLKITQLGDEYLRHQGQYPVIFLTLKDIKNQDFAQTLEKLGLLMMKIYGEHNYLLTSPRIDESDKKFYHDIVNRNASQSMVEIALERLTYYLYQHYGVKPWLLIDEYDTPIQSAYLHGYFKQMLDCLRNLFGAALKTNPYLEKAVITGILRIAKESLFSGLNNVRVHSLLDSKYSEYFGFTEAEMTELLVRANLTEQADTIRQWYNGYLVGNTVLYNPWSIANCLYDNGQLRPYWVNTSSNDLIKHLLARGDESLKENLELLLADQPIEALIDENTVFSDLEENNNALWSLLLFSGYLKAIRCEPLEEGMQCQLMPPNYEVKLLYRGIMRGWLSDALGHNKYESFLKSLTRGDVEEFTLRLEDCLQNTLSLFDVTGRQPEKFYHGFVLGMIVSLQATHEVQSNKESGFGRYDVMLIPKDPAQLGLVLEFKTVRDANTPLPEAAQEALQQIIDRGYAQTLRSKGIKSILQLGLAFYHKTVAVASAAL